MKDLCGRERRISHPGRFQTSLIEALCDPISSDVLQRSIIPTIPTWVIVWSQGWGTPSSQDTAKKRTGKGHEQEESPNLSPTPGTTFQIHLFQPIFQGWILLSFGSWQLKFNKMQLLVKIPSIFLNCKTGNSISCSRSESSCGLTFYRCRITAFNTLTFFFFYRKALKRYCTSGFPSPSFFCFNY